MRPIAAIAAVVLLGGCHLLFPFTADSSEDQGAAGDQAIATSDGQPPDHALDHKALPDHPTGTADSQRDKQQPADTPPDLVPPDMVPPDMVPPDLVPPDLVPPDMVPPDTVSSACSTWSKWSCSSDQGCLASCGSLKLLCSSGICTCADNSGKKRTCKFTTMNGINNCQIYCIPAYQSNCCLNL